MNKSIHFNFSIFDLHHPKAESDIFESIVGAVFLDTLLEEFDKIVINDKNSQN